MSQLVLNLYDTHADSQGGVIQMQKDSELRIFLITADIFCQGQTNVLAETQVENYMSTLAIHDFN